METNNIIAAPQIADVDQAYSDFLVDHVGNKDSFYAFMATPSPDRDTFMERNDSKLKIDGCVVSHTIE